MRKKTDFFDALLAEIDHALRTVHTRPPSSAREYPAAGSENSPLSESNSRHAAGLMRVNNAGEVAAQGLYRGQAWSARERQIAQSMLKAAEEENDHLNWCQQRLEDLGSQRSKLDPFWYIGSFTLGFLAGKAGDGWSLGFVEETEKQVSQHLRDHLQQLPPQDQCSQKVVQQMLVDEEKHAQWAHEAGAHSLPGPFRRAMHLVSRIMTVSAYRI